MHYFCLAPRLTRWKQSRDSLIGRESVRENKSLSVYRSYRFTVPLPHTLLIALLFDIADDQPDGWILTVMHVHCRHTYK